MTEPNTAPAADPGNQFLGAGPSGLTATVIDTPIGQRMMVTVRTTSTTLTVFLEKKHAGEWINVIKSQEEKMTSLTIPPANVQFPKLNGHPSG